MGCGTLNNLYFVCDNNSTRCTPWDPYDHDSTPITGFIEADYLADAFRELEKAAVVCDQIFYITWDTDRIPTSGRNVIVVLLGDEWCRRPRYIGNVRAVFRQYGTRPTLVLAGMSRASVVLYLQFLRAHAKGLPERVRRFLHRGTTRRPLDTGQYVIPLGYGNQSDLPIVPIASRQRDVYFAGSVNNIAAKVTSLRWWLPRPKELARRRMLVQARRMQRKRSDLSVELSTFDMHVPAAMTDRSELQRERHSYSEAMMDTKICLAPRGSSPDTPRFFEALRYGCAIIGDRLPSRWFYDGAPMITVGNWRGLGNLVDNLITDHHRLEELHWQAVTYWEERCSGRALAQYVATVLQDTSAGSPADVVDQ